VGLVVGQQGGGEAGVVAVVDPVQGVGQLLGLVSGDEGRGPYALYGIDYGNYAGLTSPLLADYQAHADAAGGLFAR
jgi:hypothetical protein